MNSIAIPEATSSPCRPWRTWNCWPRRRQPSGDRGDPPKSGGKVRVAEIDRARRHRSVKRRSAWTWLYPRTASWSPETSRRKRESLRASSRTTNADVNHTVKRTLDVRKAPSGRRSGRWKLRVRRITPVGVPTSWRLLIDSRSVEELTHHRLGAAPLEALCPRWIPRHFPGGGSH